MGAIVLIILKYFFAAGAVLKIIWGILSHVTRLNKLGAKRERENILYNCRLLKKFKNLRK